MFFIAGITGRVGSAAAHRLLKSGQLVRALVRDTSKATEWARKGAQVWRGDLRNSAELTGALAGVDGAFLMLPPNWAPAPGYPETKAFIASFREALRQATPPRLAVLSSIGSHQSHGLGLITQTHLLEDALADMPFPVAFVRAGSFLENYSASLPAVASTGIFHSFLQPTDRAVPMIATADIGAEVARLLLKGWTGQKIVDLGTYRSPNDIAIAMANVLGRPVRAEAVPRAAWSSILESFGVPAGATGSYEEMLEGFNSGWIDFNNPGTERVEGTTSPEKVYEEAAQSALSSAGHNR